MWQVEKWLAILFRSSVSNSGQRRIFNLQSNKSFFKKTFERLTGKTINHYINALMRLKQNTTITDLDLLKKNGREPNMYEWHDGMEWNHQPSYSIPIGFPLDIKQYADEPIPMMNRVTSVNLCRIMNHVASENFWVFSYQSRKFEDGYFVSEDVSWAHTAYYWHYKFYNQVFPYLYIFEVPKGTPFTIEYASLGKDGEIGTHFTNSDAAPSSSYIPPTAKIQPVFSWDLVNKNVTRDGPIRGNVRILSNQDDKDKVDLLEKIAKFLRDTDIDQSNDHKTLQSLVKPEEFEYIKRKFSQVNEDTTYIIFTRIYLASFIFQSNSVPLWTFYTLNTVPIVLQSYEPGNVFNTDLANAIDPFLIIELAPDRYTNLKKWVWIKKYAIIETEQLPEEVVMSARHGNEDSIISESEMLPKISRASSDPNKISRASSDPNKILENGIWRELGYEMEAGHDFTIILPPMKCEVMKTIPFENDGLTKHKFSGLQNVIFAKIIEHKVKSWTKENAQESYNHYMKKRSLQYQLDAVENAKNRLKKASSLIDDTSILFSLRETFEKKQQELDELQRIEAEREKAEKESAERGAVERAEMWRRAVRAEREKEERESAERGAVKRAEMWRRTERERAERERAERAERERAERAERGIGI